MATTELESAYCKVKAKGKGRSLPPLNDFRKNPENIQLLLLKSPARKAGIKLPKVQARAQKNPVKASVSPQNTARADTPKAPEITAKKMANNTQAAPAKAELKGCHLNETFVHCPHGRFYLQTNKPNREISGDALSPVNRLLLADRRSPQYRNVSNLIYLSETYPLYIDKMLSIGLGDSTMSFTRYAATYDEIQRQQQNFAKRFNAMFELLKTEKASNSVQRRYDDSFPQSLSQCMAASKAILVCDNVKRNWVYLRK